MILRQPTLEECELVRQWRNDPEVLPTLRTKEPLTKEQQAAFYRDVVCNPKANHRYYAIARERFAEPEIFMGLGGLTYLDRTTGEAEISLILGPQFRNKRFGSEAVQALRMKATELGLRWVVGECYLENPARTFWVKQVARCDGSARFDRDRMFFRLPAA